MLRCEWTLRTSGSTRRAVLIPGKRLPQASLDRMSGFVTQQTLRLGDVSLGVPNVAWSKVFVDRAVIPKVQELRQQLGAEQFKQLAQTGAGIDRHIEDLVPGRSKVGGCRQQVGLNDVGDKAEVPRRRAVAKDSNRGVLDHR